MPTRARTTIRIMNRLPRRSGRWWLTMALAIGLALPTLRATAQTETDATANPLEATTMTINVELILDASGSMAEAVPGTEQQTRMEAAKDAMREVIGRIPKRDGLNVGFRVYGHKGSTAEEDRPRGCRATELLVPITGVDKDALLTQVDGFEPTGWTPLTLALEAAGRDFAPGGESVTNAVIMVTDGEETCGGDPCRAAAALHAADTAVITHVVGFALSEDQQAAVRCIAEEGGGRLYAAADAASLSEAVFAALSDVEGAAQEAATAVPAMVVGEFVGGNAATLLADGVAGELSAVAFGPYRDGGLPVVIRNDTGEAVEAIGGEVIARAGDALVGVGNVQGVQPFVVADGGYALAYGYFSGADLPPDAEFAFVLTADPLGTDDITATRDLIVEEVNGGDDGIVGILSNPHKEAVSGIVIVSGICFDASGHDLTYVQSTASADRLESGGILPFSISTGLSAESCSVFLAAGSGSAE